MTVFSEGQDHLYFQAIPMVAVGKGGRLSLWILMSKTRAVDRDVISLQWSGHRHLLAHSVELEWKILTVGNLDYMETTLK